LYVGKTLQTLRIYRNLISICFSGNLDPGIFFLLERDKENRHALSLPEN
jgi:hypothetical protein